MPILPEWEPHPCPLSRGERGDNSCRFCRYGILTPGGRGRQRPYGVHGRRAQQAEGAVADSAGNSHVLCRRLPILPEFENRLPILPDFENRLPILPEFENRLPILPRFENRLPILPRFENRLPILPRFENRLPILPRFENRLPILPRFGQCGDPL